jgi:hypothetical protein
MPKLIWVTVFLIPAICYFVHRRSIFDVVAKIERKGASVRWDIDILTSEGGKMIADESRWVYSTRRLFFAKPQTVTHSTLLIGSDDFMSKDVREIYRLGAIERVAIDGLEVRYDDLDWLLSNAKVANLVLYDTGLPETDVIKLNALQRGKVMQINRAGDRGDHIKESAKGDP